MTFEEQSHIIANMEPMLTKKFVELADDVERAVPPTGKFETKFAVFEDETRNLDITKWSVAVRDLITENCSEVILRTRYIDLVGYTGGMSCIIRGVGSGSIKECAELLRSHDFVEKVRDGMMALLESYAKM